ncbi:hypothetical protein AB0M39_17965 [Streptomyces sp. NPDC051907]|uniref:hypothetical protein n=1 Tax=Streptomyces sp. NPDC051907 TaxID=3155284 RepID=UPI003425773B
MRAGQGQGQGQESLARTAEALDGTSTTAALDAHDADSCARTVETARQTPGGLDAVVTALVSAAVGAERPTTVSALAPGAAFHAFGVGGTFAAVTGAMVARPQPGMAGYRASPSAPDPSALGACLDAVCREVPAHVPVLEIRLGHLETGAQRVLAAPHTTPFAGPRGR